MSTNTATAHWTGGLKDGEGHVSTNSNALKDVPYTFKTRFEGDEGTNPEELIGAAHAGCFAMALSNILGGEDITAEYIKARADVVLEMLDEGPRVTKVQLSVNIKAPGADPAVLQDCANKAKEGCPISVLLNTEITLETTIDG